MVIIDTPQIEDHAAIARSALRYADEIVIPCAPAPIEINRTCPVLEEIAGARASCGKPARSAVLLNRCITRAHSTSDARQALEGLGYEVLATAGAGPAHGAGRQRPDAPNPPRRRLGGPRPGPSWSPWSRAPKPAGR